MIVVKNYITMELAMKVASQLGIDFESVGFTKDEFLDGINIELEHGTIDPSTDVSGDDPLVSGKIALAHLNEVSTYYHKDVGLHAWEEVLMDFKGNLDGKKLVIM